MPKTTITVYSRPDCMQCAQTCRLLNRENIPYTYTDVDADDAAREYLTERGIVSLPFVRIERDGVEIDSWTNFRVDRLKALRAHYAVV